MLKLRKYMHASILRFIRLRREDIKNHKIKVLHHRQAWTAALAVGALGPPCMDVELTYKLIFRDVIQRSPLVESN
jgi:hypothetical protein